MLTRKGEVADTDDTSLDQTYRCFNMLTHKGEVADTDDTSLDQASHLPPPTSWNS